MTGASAALVQLASIQTLEAQPLRKTVSVKTPSGALRGESVGGIQVFRGVPFAEPPVGELRFRPPVSVVPWTVERDALEFAPAAMQSGGAGMRTSEDCLYLNVWTPNTRPEKPLPVMVWIHGGGFTGGSSYSGKTNGAKFAKDGVVCVSVAYRLGVFGFMDVAPLLGPSYAGSANNGLLDVMQALTWVRNNIDAFGGDPSRVTIGGQSAGAKLTDIIMGIPAAEGLFQQAISESGGAERVNSNAAALAIAAGFGEDWAKRGGESIDSAPAKDLIEAQVNFIQHWPQHFPLRAEVDGTVIPKLPVETIAGGSTQSKALLVGTNREESASFLGPHPPQDPTASDLGNTDVATFNQIFAKYAEVYPDLNAEALRIRATTAEEYWVPSIRVADAHVKAGGKAWMYELTLKDPIGKLKGYARHSLELGLVWKAPDVPEEASLSSEIHAALVSFIKGVAPSAKGIPTWPEYNNIERATMIVDTHCRVEYKPQYAELQLWNEFLP